MVTVLSLSVSAEMLGYSYELDSPYTGVKNRAVPNVVLTSLVRPLQKMGRNIQVSFPVSLSCWNPIQKNFYDFYHHPKILFMLTLYS